MTEEQEQLIKHTASRCAQIAEATTEYGELDKFGETKAYATAAAIRECFGIQEKPSTEVKPRASFLELALSKGAKLTGKPDGSEAITVVFTIDAWRAFDDATNPNNL